MEGIPLGVELVLGLKEGTAETLARDVVGASELVGARDRVGAMDRVGASDRDGV